MMLASEELLLEAGVTIYYNATFASAGTENGAGGPRIASVAVDTKRGPARLSAKAFVDATGDADLCAFAGEKTAEFAHNSRTGWYFSFDGGTGSEGWNS